MTTVDAPARCPRCRNRLVPEWDLDLRAPVPVCLACGWHDYPAAKETAAAQGEEEMPRGVMSMPLTNNQERRPLSSAPHAELAAFEVAARQYLDLRREHKEAVAHSLALAQDVAAAAETLRGARVALDASLALNDLPAVAPAKKTKTWSRRKSDELKQNLVEIAVEPAAAEAEAETAEGSDDE